MHGTSLSGHSYWQPSISEQFHMREPVSINLNFINVLASVCKKLPCSLSQSIANQPLISQRQCTFVTAAVVPLALHNVN